MTKSIRVNKRAGEILKQLNFEKISLINISPYVWRDLRSIAKENGLFQIKISMDKKLKVKKEYKKSTFFE